MYKIVSSSQNPLEGDDWQDSFLKNYEFIVLERIEPTKLKQELEENGDSIYGVLPLKESASLLNYQKSIQTATANKNADIPYKVTFIKKTFECDVCKRKFKSETNLISHKHIHDENYQTDKKRRKCDVCHKIFFDVSTMNRHRKSHTGEKPYECEICHSVFARKDYFNLHWRMHYGVENDTFKFCNSGSVLKESVPSCRVKMKEKSRNGEPSSAEKMLTYTCEVCQKKFSRKHSLFIHKRLHLPYTCKMCNESFSMVTQFERHLKNHNPISLECKMCPEVCEHLENGIKLERPQEPKANHAYQCDICQKPLVSRSLLEEHKRVHFGIKPFQCDLCPKTFSGKGNLNCHRRIHTGERPYQCELCPRAFLSKSKLILHRRQHSGIKPYECLICKKRFSCRSNFKSHQRIHTGERPYECEICHKFFVEGSARNKHRKTHYR